METTNITATTLSRTPFVFRSPLYDSIGWIGWLRKKVVRLFRRKSRDSPTDSGTYRIFPHSSRSQSNKQKLGRITKNNLVFSQNLFSVYALPEYVHMSTAHLLHRLKRIKFFLFNFLLVDFTACDNIGTNLLMITSTVEPMESRKMRESKVHKNSIWLLPAWPLLCAA